MFAFYCELVFTTKHNFCSISEVLNLRVLVFSSSIISDFSCFPWLVLGCPVFKTILNTLEMPRLPAPASVWASILLKKESSGSSRVLLQYKYFWDCWCCKLVLYELNWNYIALLSTMEHRKEVMLNNLNIIWNDSRRLCLTVTVGNQISWCFRFL